MTSTTHPMLALTDEVRAALADGRAVVALESTIISHGMPYPRNVAMAREVEGIVRDGGAVPATIAVLDGIPRQHVRPRPACIGNHDVDLALDCLLDSRDRIRSSEAHHAAALGEQVRDQNDRSAHLCERI